MVPNQASKTEGGSNALPTSESRRIASHDECVVFIIECFLHNQHVSRAPEKPLVTDTLRSGSTASNKGVQTDWSGMFDDNENSVQIR